jgi:hypothetical protein
MRAHIELTPGEKQAFRTLTAEEREAVVDQMLEQVREDLEWVMALENARHASLTVAAQIASTPPPIPPSSARSARISAKPQPIPARRYCWPTGLARAR